MLFLFRVSFRPKAVKVPTNWVVLLSEYSQSQFREDPFLRTYLLSHPRLWTPEFSCDFGVGLLKQAGTKLPPRKSQMQKCPQCRKLFDPLPT